MKYRPEIDGLRAVAVIPVIFFHAGFTKFSGGFAGVDVFFVISGYLITTIILSEMEQGTFSIANFYERRARRILPALFLVMFICFPLAWLCLLPSHMKDFSKSLAAVSSFSSNILFWSESGYWDAASELKPLLHTWSLAVEEQYYVLFPLFLMAMWRYRKRRIFGSFMLIAGMSLAMAQWGAYHKPEATFFLLPTRGWELAIGAGIAFYFLYRRQTIQTLLSHQSVDEVLGLVGLVMIGYAIFVFDEKTPFPSLYALVPTIGTGLVIVFSTSRTIVGRLLSAKPLVAVGLMSYSAYLWHQPLFAFIRHRSFSEPSVLVFLGLAVLTFVLAYLSWKFVEQPFRNKKTTSRKTIFIFSVIGSIVFIGAGMAGYYSDGYKKRSIYKHLLVKNYQPDNRVLRDQSWHALREISGNNTYAGIDNDYDQQLWFTEDDNRQKLLLVGNSHSKDLYNVLLNSDDARAHFQIARYGTQISSLNNKSSRFYNSPNYQQSDIVMLISKYLQNDLSVIENVVENLKRDKKTIVIVKNIFEFDCYYEKNPADLHLQRKFINGANFQNLNASQIVNEIDEVYYTQYISRGRLPLPKQSDAVVEAIAKKHGILLLNRMDYVCDKEAARCFSINDKFEKYFFDYGHHTNQGAVFFGQRVDQIRWLRPLIEGHQLSG